MKVIVGEKRYSYWLPIRTIFFIAIFWVIALVSRKSVIEISKYWTLIVIICNLCTLMVIMAICKKNHMDYLSLIDFKKLKLKTVIMGCLLVTVIGIIGTYLAGFLFYHVIPYTPDVMMQSLPLGIILFDLLLFPITSTLAEEGLYLGIGLNKAHSLKCAIFFYLIQHCFFPMMIDFKYMMYRIVSLIPFVCFICFYYKNKKEILPIMLGHFTINFLATMQILLISIN